jgi:hypothetical protein
MEKDIAKEMIEVIEVQGLPMAWGVEAATTVRQLQRYLDLVKDEITEAVWTSWMTPDRAKDILEDIQSQADADVDIFGDLESLDSVARLEAYLSVWDEIQDRIAIETYWHSL